MNVHRRMWAAVGSIAAAAVMATAGTVATASAAGYPVTPNIVAGGIQAFPNPAAPPAGANVAGCRTSAPHPYPVVLVDGTFANQRDDFGALAPTLANAGYCVYTFAYGAPASQFVQGVGPVAISARTLATYVQTVLHRTGAKKVDLVGHSQGGLLAEYYAKLLHGAKYVHDLVGLSPSTHGTTLDGLLTLASVFPGANGFIGSGCMACTDQESTSSTIKAVDGKPIAQAGVTYTVIETLNETVVTPVGSAFINERGVTNEYVQASCPFDAVDHLDLPYDQVVLQLVQNALDPATAHGPNCLTEFPYPA